MGRRILDCRTMEVANLSPKEEMRIEKTLDKLNVPKDGVVQVNLGTKERE